MNKDVYHYECACSTVTSNMFLFRPENDSSTPGSSGLDTALRVWSLDDVGVRRCTLQVDGRESLGV